MKADFYGIINAANDVIVVQDMNTGKFLDVNEKFSEVYGYTKAEAQGMDVEVASEGRPPYTQSEAMALVRKAVAGDPQFFEWKAKKKSGELFWIEVNLKKIILKNKPWLIAISRDITQRKNHEILLEKKHSDLMLAQRIASIGVWTFDPEIGIPEWSEEIYRLYERNPRLGPYPINAYSAIYKGKWFDRFNNAIAEAITNGTPYDIELRLRCPSGKHKWVHAICEPEPEIGPKGHKLRGTIQDITKEKQALIALEETKNQYESIYNNAQVGLSRTRISDGKVLACNQKMADIFGYDTIDEFVAKGVLSDRYVDKARREKALSELGKTGFIQNREARFYRKDGQVIWARFDSHIFPEYGYMEDVVIDITQQKESEEKLLHQQKAISLNNKIANVFLTASRNDIFANTLDVVLETLESPFGYFGYIDDEGNLNCPSMTRHIWNKCDMPDKRIVFPKELWGGAWGESLNMAKTVICNEGLRLPDGHIQLVCAMAVPIIHHDEVIGQFAVADKENGYDQYEKFLLESAASQTAPILNSLLEKEAQEKEHKKMQARIEQAQKMEAVGNLAGGIAHDFNNILFPIIGMSELMMEDFEPNSLEYENALEINTAGKRAKDLVNQILSFSRQTEHERMPVKFQKILQEVLKLCRSSIPTNIEIEQDIQQDCGSIRANATQLHQIGMNLITNAYHAVQDKNGKIAVQLKECILDKKEKSFLSLNAGKYVRLSVFDNGTGIPEEIKDKIFEPYFTTKKKGKGTGLGLSVVYGIVKEFGGEVQVSSSVGAGTTFNIYLPLSKTHHTPNIANTGFDIKTGHEHILLVDDEPAIAQLVRLILERLGYTVTSRVNSIEALEAFKENPDKFDMVISDMSMPAMTGDQLAYEIKKIRSNMPVVICTGFSERIDKEKAEKIGVNGFLMKPILKSELTQMIRHILDESSHV